MKIHKTKWLAFMSAAHGFSKQTGILRLCIRGLADWACAKGLVFLRFFASLFSLSSFGNVLIFSFRLFRISNLECEDQWPVRWQAIFFLCIACVLSWACFRADDPMR